MSSMSSAAPAADGAVSDLQGRYRAVRSLSLDLVAPLSDADATAQSMPDASPAKWHLAHITWFFETFVLRDHVPGYQAHDDRWAFLFSSYYEAEGARHARPQRGLLTRPSLAEVIDYRARVDEAMMAAMPIIAERCPDLLALGLNHEQQHQELLLTDILALFASSPLRPAYRQPKPASVGKSEIPPLTWIEYHGGIHQVGHAGDGFSWDNEGPRHEALVHPFKLADRLVTNGEWLAFIEDGGYRTASLWLADGWTTVNREHWQAPLYWENLDDQWFAMSLEGRRPLDMAAPVCNVSYFEADAFARWSGKRLPTEFEWEVAAASAPKAGNDLATGALRPLPAGPSVAGTPRQMFGDVWEWTQSAYLPYPGYKPPEGAIGEYNGKFMVSQQVLRGSSCATPPGHARSTYRNFFYPQQRWQFVGLRLASDIT